MNDQSASAGLSVDISANDGENKATCSESACQSQSLSGHNMDYFDVKAITQSSRDKEFGRSSSFESSPSGIASSPELPSGQHRSIYDKPNHSEVEKRRRRRINRLIEELASVIPSTSKSGKKPDKLTILKMAVQNVRLHVRADKEDSSTNYFIPPYLKEDELQALLECATGGFLFIASIDQYQILFMSDKVKDILGFSSANLIGKRLIDLVHPRDTKTLKDQFTIPHVCGTGTSQSSLRSESEDESKNQAAVIFRREFFCRFRQSKTQSEDTSHAQHRHIVGKPKAKAYNLKDDDMKDYCIVHCAGYLKTWLLPEEHLAIDNDTSSISCFYGIGRKVEVFSENEPRRNLSGDIPEFSNRCSIEGKYLYIDPRMVAVLGYLPQDLIGQNWYDFIHHDDVFTLQQTIANVKKLQSSELLLSDGYRMVAKNGSLVEVVTVLFNFRNPFSDDIEYICMQSAVLE